LVPVERERVRKKKEQYIVFIVIKRENEETKYHRLFPIIIPYISIVEIEMQWLKYFIQ